MDKAAKWMMMAAMAGTLAAGTWADIVTLSDGSVVRGEIVKRDDSLAVLRSPSLGEVTLRVSQIAFIQPQASAATADPAGPSAPSERPIRRDPSDQALFFLPTAFLPPERSFTFRDFELFFMTFGYSPTERTAISAGLLFPVSSEVQVLTAGIKQNLWSDRQGTAVSLTGNLTKPMGKLGDDMGLLVNANLVAGKRLRDREGAEAFGFHGAIGYVGQSSEEEEWDPVNGDYQEKEVWKGAFDFGLGFEAVMTPHAKFLAEYISAAPFDGDMDIDGGLLTLGFRLHGERLAADIAGVRPITGEDLGSFVLWPLLVVSYRI